MKTKTPTKPRKSTQTKTKATTKKKPPVVTRENGQVTINAEALDDLIEQTIANLFVIQSAWGKISLKEELK